MIVPSGHMIQCRGLAPGKVVYVTIFRRNDSQAWDKTVFSYAAYSPAEQFRVMMLEGSSGVYYVDMAGKPGLLGIGEVAVFVDDQEVEREALRFDEDGITIDPLPIVESIAAIIEELLASMGPENYCRTVLDVDRRRLPVNSPTDRLCVLAMDDPEELGAEGESQSCRDWVQVFYAVVYCVGDETPDRAQNIIWSDIYKTIMADPTLGGTVFDAVVLPYERLPDCMSVPIRVQYRTARNDITNP